MSRSSGVKLIPILVVAGLGFVLAKFVTASPSYYVMAITVAVLGGLILLNKLEYGLFAFMYIAALAFGESPEVQSQYSGYSAGLMPSQMLLIFLGAIFIFRYAFIERIQLVRSELNRPLLAISVISVLSLIVNNVLDATRKQLFHQQMITQVAEVGLLLFSVCAFFLTANVLKDDTRINRIYTPVVLLGTYFAAHRIFDFDLPIPLFWGSFLLAGSIAFVYSRLLFGEIEKSKRIPMALLLAMLLYAAFSNLEWLSGLVATITAVTVVSWYKSKPLVAVILLLGVVVLFFYPGIYWDIHNESAEGGDFDRFTIWADSFRMFMAVNPVLGIGPGNYYPYVYYHNTIWFGGGATYTTAHSNYAQMAAELGLLGFGAFIWIIVGGLRLGIRAARNRASEHRWLGIAATAIFAGMVLASLFGDYMFPSRGNNGIVNFGTTVYTWMIMGAAAAIANSSRHEA